VSGKKPSASAAKQHKATVKKLRAKLRRADAKAERWKKKAGRLEKTAAESQAQVKKLNKRLEKAPREAEQWQAPANEAPSDLAIEMPLEESTAVDSLPALDSQPAATPDASWTVIELRAEARSRGLSGLSGKTKAQLLDALT
jgi:hypothetical protein